MGKMKINKIFIDKSLSSFLTPHSSFLIILLAVMLLTSALSLNADPTNYTYNYDFWFEQVSSPDAYRVSEYILGTSL